MGSRRQYKKDPNRGRGCLKMGIPAQGGNDKQGYQAKGRL